MNPINLQLNAAVQGMAAKLFPNGFDVADVAPESLEQLNAQLERGRMVVWSGASDSSIYGDPEINYAFRAWHDWVHWRYQLPFSPEGERAAAYVQVAHLARVYGSDEDAVEMAALILSEVIGQAQEFERSGQFPADQVAFAIEDAERWKPLAEDLLKRFEEKSDRFAIQVAKRDHHHQPLKEAA